MTDFALKSFRSDELVPISAELAEIAQSSGLNWIHEEDGYYFVRLGDLSFHVRMMTALDQIDEAKPLDLNLGDD